MERRRPQCVQVKRRPTAALAMPPVGFCALTRLVFVALCTSEATAPMDVAGMKMLIGRLGSRRITANARKYSTESIAGPVAANAERARVELLAMQERRERVEGAAKALTIIYERVRTELRSVVAQARAAGTRGRPTAY